MEKLIKNAYGQWSLIKSYDPKNDKQYNDAIKHRDKAKAAGEDTSRVDKFLQHYMKNDAVSKARYAPQGEKHSGPEPESYELPSGHTLKRVGRWDAAGDLHNSGTDTWELHHPKKPHTPVGFVEVRHGEHQVPNIDFAGAGHSFGHLSEEPGYDHLHEDEVDRMGNKEFKDNAHHIIPALTKHYGYLNVSDGHDANPSKVKSEDPSIDQYRGNRRHEYTYQKPSKVNYTPKMFSGESGVPGVGSVPSPEEDKMTGQTRSSEIKRLNDAVKSKMLPGQKAPAAAKAKKESLN